MHTMKSEWIKTTSTKLLLWMGIAALAFSMLNLAVPLGIGIAVDEAAFTDEGFVASLFGATLSSALFAFILGIVAMTAEYRHNTIAPTFLATPQRTRVMAAKAIVLAGIGALLGLAVYALNVIVALIVLLTKDHAPIPWGALPANAGWTMLGFALFAAFGVTFGALIRGQATAIVIAVVWLLMAEGVVSLIKPEIGKWLPGQALKSLSSTDVSFAISADAAAPLPAYAAVIVLIATIVVFGIAAALTTLKRDVT